MAPRFTRSRNNVTRNKAVAEGAVAFFLGDQVAARIARLAYGVECLAYFDEENPEHVARRLQICHRPSGRKTLPNSFLSMLHKVRFPSPHPRTRCPPPSLAQSTFQVSLGIVELQVQEPDCPILAAASDAPWNCVLRVGHPQRPALGPLAVTRRKRQQWCGPVAPYERVLDGFRGHHVCSMAHSCQDTHSHGLM